MILTFYHDKRRALILRAEKQHVSLRWQAFDGGQGDLRQFRIFAAFAFQAEDLLDFLQRVVGPFDVEFNIAQNRLLARERRGEKLPRRE